MVVSRESNREMRLNIFDYPRIVKVARNPMNEAPLSNCWRHNPIFIEVTLMLRGLCDVDCGDLWDTISIASAGTLQIIRH